MINKTDKIVTYLFINLDHDASRQEIVSKLHGIPEIAGVHVLYGTYDMLLRIESENSHQIKDIILRSVRRLEFVSKTMTMLSLDTWDRD